MSVKNMSFKKNMALKTLLLGTALGVSLSGCATLSDMTAKLKAPKSQETKTVDAVAAAPVVEVSVNPVWPKVKDAGLVDAAVEAKIDALMSQMTLEEKVGQTVQADIASIKPEDLKTYPLGSILAGGNSSPDGNERATPKAWLDLADAFWKANEARPTKAYIPLLFGIDAVHGHSNLVGAIIFPHNIGLGAARNPTLMRKIGEVTAKEMAIVGVDWTFAPTVATPQDDRWGRAFEGFSEHPDVVRAYAGEVVKGLQGEKGGDEGIKPGFIMATAKHYLGDGGTKDGIDQGNAIISEEELALIHNAGYPSSIEAGTLSVMASFSSWNGTKITGNKYLLTNVLKERMGFDGFVVSDWNAHGQVPGCTNQDCPQAINAGIDMYMAPDSWKPIYENTLKAVKEGRVPMARLDDAVRRIIRAKIKGGLYELGAPNSRPLSGQFQHLGSPEHRAIARQAVRESLVLLKNNGVLPLKANARVLVAGDGADNIGKQSGGWTLTWQGTGNSNSDFPNGQSIFGGISEALKASGGVAELSVKGAYKKKPDVAIVVIGEEPYAEFQGDRPNLDYKPGDESELALIKSLKAKGIPVVTVFLSGRPMFTNPEINASDAFVAAWLPGSEGAGVSDVLIGDKAGKPRFDFKGTLSFSWPKKANQGPLNAPVAGLPSKPYDPQFAYGYGLSYAKPFDIGLLDEDSGLKSAGIVNLENWFDAGRAKEPWGIELFDEKGTQSVAGNGLSPSFSLKLEVTDTVAQESGRILNFSGTKPSGFKITGEAVDLSRQTLGDMVVRFHYKLNVLPTSAVRLSVQDASGKAFGGDITADLVKPGLNKWATLNVRLSCFRDLGADMKAISAPFILTASGPTSLTFDQIKLASNDMGNAVCPK